MQHLSIPAALFFLLASVSILGADDDMRAGAGMVAITPPAGVPLAGYYHKRGASGVHDELYSRAIVIEKNGIQAAIVSLDLISTRRGFVEKARELINERTGIPSENVMISATHAHTGPVLADDRLFESQGASDPAAAAFMKELPGKIAQSVGAAYKRLVEAEAIEIGHHWNAREAKLVVGPVLCKGPCVQTERREIKKHIPNPPLPGIPQQKL